MRYSLFVLIEPSSVKKNLETRNMRSDLPDTIVVKLDSEGKYPSLQKFSVVNTLTCMTTSNSRF